jgi:hypothetical protein
LRAWGPEGHGLVARIALTQLTPAAKARIAEILGPDQTMVSVASWADDVRPERRNTAPWHFVDIPIAAKNLDMARDCAGGCIVAKIGEEARAVQDPATPLGQRREALMFLIHFMGDLHQPLHCADNNDRGGNTVRVLFFDRQTNLHTVWDSGLIGRMLPEDQLLTELSRAAAQHAAGWRKGTVVQWAEETHGLARKMVYGRLPKVQNGAPVPLAADYEKKAGPLVKEQLAKGGVRLAALLNDTLR